MKVSLKQIKVRDLFDQYQDSEEEGVTGYHGQLNIRPKFQREFVYKDTQRDAVIETVRRDFPLNVMYWSLNTDGTYDLLDGQQRTLSICQYLNGEYSIAFRSFNNLTPDEQEQLLNYEMTVYICEGTDSEKLAWFKVINIAGEKLTEQELRNAAYAGPWLTDAKRYFSKSGCVAYQQGSWMMAGTPIRQDYLQTVLKWVAALDGVSIEAYMSKHQQDADATALWNYFDNVYNWVSKLFREPAVAKQRRELTQVPWGLYYNQYSTNQYDINALRSRTQTLMADDDVTKKAGVYEYLLDGQEKHLSIRTFDRRTIRETYEKQEHKCAICGKPFEIDEMQADHIIPWSKGGKTVAENCQMLCTADNLKKSDK